METIYRRWDCHSIAFGTQYIAAPGNGVTILDRKTLEVRHHFSGIRYIHKGLFVDDLTFMVFTGEQKLHFLDLKNMENAWSPPRPKYLASSGDMKCCLIPGTKMVACIAQGRKSLEEHYLLYVDYENRSVTAFPIPDCYRVIGSVVWNPLSGITFLCYQAKGDDVNSLFKIMGTKEPGQFSVLRQGELPGTRCLYSGEYLFYGNRSDPPELYAYPLTHSADGTMIEPLSPFRVELPVFAVKSLFGESWSTLPYLEGVDSQQEMLISRWNDWLGVYDLRKRELRYECTMDFPWCAAIVDQKLLIGGGSGLFVEEFPK